MNNSLDLLHKQYYKNRFNYGNFKVLVLISTTNKVNIKIFKDK
jgi:hypothetical protein